MTKISSKKKFASKRHITLSDLARELGLSKRAVSQALRDRPGTVRISPGTRERVRALAEKRGYRQNPAARALFTGRSGIFGVLSFHGYMHHLQLRVAATVEEFQKHGLVPIVVHAWIEDGDPDLRNVHLLIDARVNGVLITTGGKIAQRYANELLAYGIPVVATSKEEIAHIPNFTTRRQHGFRLLTEHLIGRGYRKLAIIAHLRVNGVQNIGAIEAIEGVTQAIKASGKARSSITLKKIDCASITRHEELSLLPDIHGLHADGYLAMWHLIDQGNLPEAILCQVDGFAIGALRACAEAGLRVPEDIAITGYGNDPAATASTIPITTIEEPDDKLCELAVRHLIELSEGTEEIKPQMTVLPGKLIVRRSSSREWGNLPKDLFALEVSTRKR